MLASRSDRQEEMDDPALDAATYRRALADLAALNRLTQTHRPVLRWLDAAVGRGGAGEFSVLDVACGEGDLLREIAALAARRGWRTSLRGIDLNPRATAAARAATPAGLPITYETGDVFTHAPQPPPDFIVTSQFPHHLSDPCIVALLQWFERTARRGWMITDLHRHFLPFYGFRLLARAMRWHRIVREDGTISIARGFRRREWETLLRKAGVDAPIVWHLPFRHTIGRLKRPG